MDSKIVGLIGTQESIKEYVHKVDFTLQQEHKEEENMFEKREL